MIIKSVTIELALTISPKQYESVRSAGSATVELAEGDDPEAAFSMARELVKKHVEGQAVHVIQANWGEK